MSFEVWDQDCENFKLANRDILTWGYQNPYIFPCQDKDKSQNVKYNMDTKTGCATQVAQSPIGIRNIKTENHLFWGEEFGGQRDLLTPSQDTKLMSNHASDRVLYDTYHKQEVHSPCYPEVDRHTWDNITRSNFIWNREKLTFNRFSIA